MKRIISVKEFWDPEEDAPEPHYYRDRDLDEKDLKFGCFCVIPGQAALLWRKPSRRDLWLLQLETEDFCADDEMEVLGYREHRYNEDFEPTDGQACQTFATDLVNGEPDLMRGIREADLRKPIGEGVADWTSQESILIKIDEELAEALFEEWSEWAKDRRSDFDPNKTIKGNDRWEEMLNVLTHRFPGID